MKQSKPVTRTTLKELFASLTAAALLLLMLFFAVRAYQYAGHYEEITRTMVEKHDLSNLSGNKLKKIADTLTFGLYKGYEELVAVEEKSREAQAFFRDRANLYTINFTITLLAMTVLYLVVSKRLFTIYLSFAGMIALVTGVITPIMMMSIHKDVEYLGDVILMMESKGVLGSISKLVEGGDWVVGGILFAFSVLFPLLKTLSMLFVALFVESRFAHTIVHFFKLIGKWSMADVFVVSTFLVYFSASKGSMSQAEVQVGFYFFFIYVIVSMLTSLAADRMLQENKRA